MSALDIKCPTCEANPGKECSWGVTTVRRFHKSRQHADCNAKPEQVVDQDDAVSVLVDNPDLERIEPVL